MRELAPGHEEYWFETYGQVALTGEPARFQNQAAQLHRWYLLTQCFGNLLDNAVRFVAPGVKPRVRVRAEEMRNAERGMQSGEGRREIPSGEGQGAGVATNGRAVSASPVTPQPPHFVRIWVEDNGIGIPEASQERVFRLFQRLHREGEYDGIGTGLAIVRKAVERMGGRLGLISQPGEGSRFWVELPRPEAS